MSRVRHSGNAGSGCRRTLSSLLVRTPRRMHSLQAQTLGCLEPTWSLGMQGSHFEADMGKGHFGMALASRGLLSGRLLAASLDSRALSGTSAAVPPIRLCPTSRLARTPVSVSVGQPGP